MRRNDTIQEAYGAGKYALATDGSWNAARYFSFDEIESGIAPLPIGPDGKRASIVNGLADAVLATTKNPELAKQWVGYLAAQCQDVVGASGMAFPARLSSSEIARQAFVDQGIDPTVFFDMAASDDGVSFPIADHWSETLAIMEPAVESLLISQSTPAKLREAAAQVNQLFAGE